MAVELPRIKQNDVVGAAPLPKAEAIGAAEGRQLGINQAELIENTAIKGIDAFDKFQDNAAKNRAKFLSNNYNKTMDVLTSEFAAIPLGGDLTEKYIELKQQQDKTKEFARKEALDSRTRAYLEQELNRQDAVLNRPIELKYAQANVAFQLQNTKDKNDILKRRFMTQSAFYDPKDPTSFEVLDQSLKDIDKNTGDFAQAMGVVSTDKSGQPIYPDNVKKDMQDTKSEAVMLAVNSLMSNNDPARAKFLLDRYGDNLDPKQVGSLNDKVNRSIRNRGYYEAANEIAKDPNLENQLAAVELYADKTKDPEAKTKVVNIVSSINTKRKAAEDQKQKNLYDDLADKLIKNQSNPTNRLYTVDEIATNPVFSTQYDMLTSENKKKIQGLIKRPTESDPETLKQFEAQTNAPDGWRGIPSKEFVKNGAKLSDFDYDIYARQFKSDNNPNKKGLTTQVKNQFVSEVQKALQANGVLPKSNEPEFVNEWNNNYSNFVISEIEKLPANTTKTTVDYQQAVKRVVDEIIKDHYDKSNAFERFKFLIKHKFKSPAEVSAEQNKQAPPPSVKKTRQEILDEL